MSASLERITSLLETDPYRVDLLVERLLLRAAQGDLTRANEDLGTLQRLGVARGFIGRLSAVVAGKLKVQEEAPAYLLIDPELPSALIGWTIHFLYEARSAADEFFGPTECRLIVELSRSNAGLHHASCEVPGLGFMKLSPRNSLVEHEALVTHELAHVYLTSGNRFLDEGIAVFFQARNSDRIFVGTEFESTTVLRDCRESLPSLRAMLAYDGRNDIFFDRLVLDARTRQALYAAGHVVAKYLFENLHCKEMKALCARLRCCTEPAAHPLIVSRYLGKSIDALDRALFERDGTIPQLPVEGLQASDESQRPMIWSVCTPSERTARLHQLRAALAAESSATALKLDLARLLVQQILSSPPASSCADVAEARALAIEMLADEQCTQRDRLVLEAWVAIAQIHAAQTVAARVLAWERAVELFRRALASFPDDPEVQCATAALHLCGPAQYGANRALARTCLANARSREDWVPVADLIENAYGRQSAN